MAVTIQDRGHSPWCARERYGDVCDCHLAAKEGKKMETPKLKEPGAKPDVDPFNPLKEKELPLHVQRMAAETQQVVARLRNLDGFLQTKTFQQLPDLEQALMQTQREEMLAYARTLSLRYCMALLDHG